MSHGKEAGKIFVPDCFNSCMFLIVLKSHAWELYLIPHLSLVSTQQLQPKQTFVVKYLGQMFDVLTLLLFGKKYIHLFTGHSTFNMLQFTINAFNTLCHHMPVFCVPKECEIFSLLFFFFFFEVMLKLSMRKKCEREEEQYMKNILREEL